MVAGSGDATISIASMSQEMEKNVDLGRSRNSWRRNSMR
jgi:hypothetical protein